MDALAKLGMAHGIKLGVSKDLVESSVLNDGRGATVAPVMLAQDLRLVQALGQRALLLKLSKELHACILCTLRDCEAEGGEVLDLEGLGVVRLGRDRDDLVVFIKVEELDLRRQVLKGCAGPLDELRVGVRELQALGLTLVGDLHGSFLFGKHWQVGFLLVFWLISSTY